MSPRRLTLTLAACLLLGLLINFTIAAILGARPAASATPTGFGFVSETFAPSVNWAGDLGRDRLAIASDHGFDGTTTAQLESRFRAVFGKPNGTMTPHDLSLWSSRLFPRWGDWAFRVSATEGSRRIYATGFPLRSFAGYDSGAEVSFSVPKPTGRYRESGFLWRDNNSPIRAVVYIPLPLGTIINSTLYAAPFLAIALFPTLRRALRRRRGHCPRCNYDLRHDLLSGCPECGRNRAIPTKT